MVLIVDDKQENLFSLRTLLMLHLYEVDTAMWGEEALKKILKMIMRSSYWMSKCRKWMDMKLPKRSRNIY